MKKTIKLIIIMLISIVLIFNIPLYSNAAESLDSMINKADSFINGGGTPPGVDPSKLNGIAQTISGVLLTIAWGVTLLSAVIMGLNFLVQSVEDKAQVKESMVPWVIGIIIAFGAYGIWRITMSVFM